MFLPIGFVVACALWLFIDTKKTKPLSKKTSSAAVTMSTATPTPASKKRGCCGEIWFFVKAFFHSVKVGAVLVFTNRCLIWLIPAYVLPLIIHRYLVNASKSL